VLLCDAELNITHLTKEFIAHAFLIFTKQVNRKKSKHSQRNKYKILPFFLLVLLS